MDTKVNTATSPTTTPLMLRVSQLNSYTTHFLTAEEGRTLRDQLSAALAELGADEQADAPKTTLTPVLGGPEEGEGSLVEVPRCDQSS